MPTSRLLQIATVLVLSLGLIHSLRAQENKAPADPAKPHGEPTKESSKESSREPATPPLSVSEHTVTISGKPVKYKVTAGYLVLKEESEKPAEGKGAEAKPGDAADGGKDNLKAKAKIFFTAYTVESGDAGTRPISFAFNGGPGAASVWLHLGALGPRRIKLAESGDGTAPPYRLVDNEYSWLDQTDLVFIDPVSTGYSRPVAGESARSFHGFNEDLQSVAEFIRLYTTQNNRWLSPKFLVGESYGGTRAAAIAGVLEDRFDIYTNGIIIVSGVLDFQTLDFKVGNDLGYPLYLPSYAAAAWYHKMLPPAGQQKTEEQIRQEAEAFAAKDYLLALSQGSTLPDAERTRIAGRMAELTGLPVDTILDHHLRITPGLFRDELLKPKHKTIGRFDDRLTGIAYDPEGADFEPSFALIRGAFTAGINAYLRGELKFQTEVPYYSLANVSPWNYSNVENRYLEVANSMATAMTKNPRLKVWVVCGYYDLAVPYFSTDYALREMHLDASLRGNIRFNKYPGGHMLYSQEPVLKQFTADFDDFIANTLK